MVVLDIDKLSKEQLTNAKALASQSPYTFASFTSPSGTGLKILVKVNSEQSQHKEAFLKLQKYYEELLALPIDKSGKDVTRLCFISNDPELYYNESASVFPVIEKIESCHTELAEVNTSSNGETPQSYDVVYEHCVRFTEKKETYVEGNRNNFVHQLACNLNRKGMNTIENKQAFIKSVA